MPENTVNVARPNPLGNPFKVYEHCKGGDWGVLNLGRLHESMGHGWTRVGAAAFAVARFRELIDDVYPPGSTARVILAVTLLGQNVACWCPLLDEAGGQFPCHGHVILDIGREAAW